MSANKYLRILLAAVLLAPFTVKAQNKNIGIGTSNPDPAAILDISSTNKGVLVPRLTTAQINAINTPPEGLMVYNLDTACYFYYNKFKWESLCHDEYASNGTHLGVINGETHVLLGGPLTQNTDIPLSGYKLTFSTAGSKGNVGIGNNNPDASAVLDLSNSNNTGILLPKVILTDTNVAAPVTAPATGLIVYNTNTQNNVVPGYYYWNGGKWMRIFSTNLPVVSTVSVTAPIVNTGTAQDPNIGLTTSNLTGGTVMNITNGANVLAGSTGAVVDVMGAQGGVLYGTGTSSDFTPAGTTGQYLQSQGTGAPAWTTGSDLTGSTVVTVTNGTGQGVGTGNASIDVTGPAGTVMYGTGTSSDFTAQGVAGQVLQSQGAGAPTWVNPNAALVASDLVGSSVLSVTNGTNKVVGVGNTNLDVVGANGGVMYGTGTSSAFTPAGTSGQVLRSTGAGAPVWSSPNATLTTNNVTGSSVMNITNGNGQVVGGTNMNIDVAGTAGGLLYGTGGSSAFSTAGTAGQYLQSTGSGAPVWSTINLTTSDLTGSSVVSITNGTNRVFGAGNAGVDVSGTNGGVLYGTGTSSAFTPVGTSGQVLRSNGAAAPTWTSANSLLTTTTITGSGPVTVTNGTAQTIGSGNPTITVAGTANGVLYGTGASSTFTAASTAANQVLYTPTAGGTPQWGTLGGGSIAWYSGGVAVTNAPNYPVGEQAFIGYLNSLTGLYYSTKTYYAYTAAVQPTLLMMPKCVITRIYVSLSANSATGTTTFAVYNASTATATNFGSIPAATTGNFTFNGSAAVADGNLIAIRSIGSTATGSVTIYQINVDYYLLP